MSDETPIDELISAVLDGEATPAEVERAETDPELADRLERFRAVSERVAEAPPAPEGLAESAVAAALADLESGDELAQRRRGRATALAPLLAAAALLVVVALAAAALIGSDGAGENSDTVAAPLDDDDSAGDLGSADASDSLTAGEDEAADAGSVADSAEASAPAPVFEGSGDSGTFSAARFIVASDLADFEAQVRSQLEQQTDASDGSAQEERSGDTCDLRSLAQRTDPDRLVASGDGTLADDPVSYGVFTTADDGTVLIVAGQNCTLVAERDL